ncbi:cytochrome P450 monooxygenase, nitrosative stress-induced transcript [Histoplasma capsulatum var. duboisii H88]|uniref:Cytochrome P450 monooxygenase, nitrosative stress-induced transcript n=3 Tax=Ajellomyces capsulatus TaxID=5037 RepID=A0A8A1LDH9_AJEC8|nr:cytochrome P450 monooxygenase, nitrosative stress-induced transcript [Histoplasma capsulatum var. duboisii H88]
MILNICRSMYRTINSPFPGPKLAKFTSLWLRWHELRDGILNTTHRAHRNYGPIVQLSPKMISFCHPDAIKDIYTGPRGGLDAIDLVWFFERYGSPNVVSTVDAELHLIRRKNVAGLYSSPVAASPAFQAHIKTTIDTLMNEIEAEAGSEQPLSWTVDVFPMMRWLAADIMIGLTYGHEKPLNLLSNPDSRAQLNELLTPTLELVASPLMTAFQWLPLPIVKLLSPLINPGSKLTTFGMSLVQESLKSLPLQSKDDDGRKANTHLQHLLCLFKKDGPSLAIPNINYIASDTLDHFSGGTTTTADFLSALLYHLSLPENKHHQDKLRQELRTVSNGSCPASSTEHIPLSQLQALPYLNGVLRETLRISPPIPFSLPRVVKTKDQDVTVMGLKINPGTIISIQPHTLHRDPDTFPNPDVWDPERWQVPITSPAHRQMQRMLMPFGYGQRMCTGINVAWAIMRQVTASIYREYETSLDEGVWYEADGELASKDVKHENRRRKKKNLFPDGGVQPIVFRRV